MDIVVDAKTFKLLELLATREGCTSKEALDRALRKFLESYGVEIKNV